MIARPLVSVSPSVLFPSANNSIRSLTMACPEHAEIILCLATNGRLKDASSSFVLTNSTCSVCLMALFVPPNTVIATFAQSSLTPTQKSASRGGFVMPPSVATALWHTVASQKQTESKCNGTCAMDTVLARCGSGGGHPVHLGCYAQAYRIARDAQSSERGKIICPCFGCQVPLEEDTMRMESISGSDSKGNQGSPSS